MENPTPIRASLSDVKVIMVVMHALLVKWLHQAGSSTQVPVARRLWVPKVTCCPV
jgi:hypothetical protein